MFAKTSIVDNILSLKMSLTQRSSQYVEVQLEIGHKATPKTRKSEEGHTHDWSVIHSKIPFIELIKIGVNIGQSS